MFKYMFCRTQNIPECFCWPLNYTTTLQVVGVVHSLQFNSCHMKPQSLVLLSITFHSLEFRIRPGNFSGIVSPCAAYRGERKSQGMMMCSSVCSS